MTTEQIKIIGISIKLQIYIEEFMKNVIFNKIVHLQSLPIISLARLTIHYDNNMNPIHAAMNTFVLGAIENCKIEDEIIYNKDNMCVAIRIPCREEFFGSYYFDLDNKKIINSV